MARRNNTPPIEKKSANLSIDQIQRALPKLGKRLSELNEFDPIKAAQDENIATALEDKIDDTLVDIFGINTIDYDRYKVRSLYKHGVISLVSDYQRQQSLEEMAEPYEGGKKEAISKIETLITVLKEKIEDADPINANTTTPIDTKPLSDKVFIVHGHDDGARETVARFIEQIGFNPIILHDRPNKGRTIITKFQEEAADIGFAIVLMTPDDVGGKDDQNLKPRARQNVVFELGFFIGKLGASKVAALVKGDIEHLSDFDGVLYTALDNGDWKAKLGRELEAAGYTIDWNKIMRSA